MKRVLTGLCFCLFLLDTALTNHTVYGKTKSISNVRVYPSSFNPSIGQHAEIDFSLANAGELSVLILDRDGFPTRTLANNKKFTAGPQHLSWDGRDDEGEVVPNEAWSLKIDLLSMKEREAYFPGDKISENTSIPPDYYHVETAILALNLPSASRLHIQAGCAIEDPKTKKPYGPVMKTLVNREPRVAGPNTIFWDGFDESGTIFIPDLPNFRISIALSPLPENSLITTGNRTISFVEKILNGRNGKSLFTYQVSNHHHHSGLNAVEDVSPALRIKPIKGAWNSKEQLWEIAEKNIEIAGFVEGPTAKYFVKQPAMIEVFVDNERVLKTKPTSQTFYLTIPLKIDDPKSHILSVNWGSDYGPATVNSMRFRVASNATVLKEKRL